MSKAVSRQETYQYKWCQYSDDVSHGLWTVQQIIERDHCKVYSQAEAAALVARLNKEAKK